MEAAPSLVDGIELLARVEAAGRAHETAVYALVEAVDAARRSGTVERLEGLPLDLWLGLALRLTGADRWLLLCAGQVLADLPATTALWRDGRLSWSQVRGIVARVRRLRRADRGGVDAAVAASLDLVDRLDPDQLAWAVERACDEADGAAAVARRERAAAGDEFLAAQANWTAQLDGGGTLYARYGPVNFATVLGFIDAHSPPPQADAGQPGQATSRARQRAAGAAHAAAPCAPATRAAASPARVPPPPPVTSITCSTAPTAATTTPTGWCAWTGAATGWCTATAGSWRWTPTTPR